jgi:hypothetical protein
VIGLQKVRILLGNVTVHEVRCYVIFVASVIVVLFGFKSNKSKILCRQYVLQSSNSLFLYEEHHSFTNRIA